MTDAKQEQKEGPMELTGIQLKTFPVESETTPGKYWSVTLWMTNWRGFYQGQLSCNCPAWLYRHQPVNIRHCKHTDRIARQLSTHKELVEKTVKSEVFLKSDLPANGRLKALISSMLSE